MIGRGQWLYRYSVFRFCPLLLAALVCSLSLIGARAQDVGAQDYSRITQVPRAEMDAWIKQEVAASGGNWNTDRYHFYIGFSTGHFGQDPVQAIAMRRLAFSLMNNSLAVGDRVTPIAWEMNTWNVGPTVALTDAPASRAEFVNRVPYTPHSGSNGGHDIEKVLYETITQSIPTSERQSAIVLLLTNSNASQGPTGERAKLFGADNPLLLDAIREGGFRQPPVRREFRFLAGSQPVTVAITALFPQKLASLPDPPATSRYPTFARETWQPTADRPAPAETLPNPVRTETVQKSTRQVVTSPTRSGIPGWGWTSLIVVVIVVGFLLLSHRFKPATVDSAVAKPAPSAPQGAPIPGSLTVIVGPEEQVLQPLTTISRWTLQREGNGKSTLIPVSDTPEKRMEGESVPAPVVGTPLAKLAFDPKRSLHVEAEPGAQFIELQGTAASRSESRLLLIEPGKRVLCRVVPADATTKTRLEIIYDAQKGSRS